MMMVRRSISLCVLVIFFASCEKESDQRDQFVGTFIGTRTNTSWMMGQPPDTETFTDTVEVTLSGDSSLRIDATVIPVDEEGKGFLSGGTASSYYSVSFPPPDSIVVETNSGGLGGGFHSSFEGRKHP